MTLDEMMAIAAKRSPGEWGFRGLNKRPEHTVCGPDDTWVIECYGFNRGDTEQAADNAKFIAMVANNWEAITKTLIAFDFACQLASSGGNSRMERFLEGIGIVDG